MRHLTKLYIFTLALHQLPQSTPVRPLLAHENDEDVIQSQCRYSHTWKSPVSIPADKGVWLPASLTLSLTITRGLNPPFYCNDSGELGLLLHLSFDSLPGFNRSDRIDCFLPRHPPKQTLLVFLPPRRRSPPIRRTDRIIIAENGTCTPATMTKTPLIIARVMRRVASEKSPSSLEGSLSISWGCIQILGQGLRTMGVHGGLLSTGTC